MRLSALLVAICALSPAAVAQTGDCKSIPDANAQLACYNRAPPPPAKPAAAAKVPRPKSDSTKYVDTISAEDARMNAHLNSICRGC